MTAEHIFRLEQIEERVGKIEDRHEKVLDDIYKQLNSLNISVNSLQTAIVAHNATLLRVERLELKMLEIEKDTMIKFHTIDKQKAWVLGIWSACGFFGAIIGTLATILLKQWIK